MSEFRHTFRVTEVNERGEAVQPPPGMISVRERTIPAGHAFAMLGGGVYVVGKTGQLLRADKRHESKKERRMRRATVKAVRAARPDEGGP